MWRWWSRLSSLRGRHGRGRVKVENLARDLRVVNRDVDILTHPVLPSSPMSETLAQRTPTPPGRLVRVERVRRGLRQEELAALVEMDRGRLSRIETGGVTPSIPEAAKLSKALGLDPRIWFGEDGPS